MKQGSWGYDFHTKERTMPVETLFRPASLNFFDVSLNRYDKIPKTASPLTRSRG